MNETNYTSFGHFEVYCYTVYWQHTIFEERWLHKPFANKKEAQKFAKKYKDRKHPPYPYIIRTIVERNYFRKDVEVEAATGSIRRKLIKY